MSEIQFKYLIQDINRILGRNKLRIISLPFSRVFWGIFIYRFERSLFLVLGKYYKFLRLFLLPIYALIYWYSNIEIHYEANIKGGISIAHASLGAVVSGKSTIGKNLSMVGGNCIGLKRKLGNEAFLLGDNLTLGANAIILGPIELGDNVSIGAGACVTKSFYDSNITLVGVPAKKTC